MKRDDKGEIWDAKIENYSFIDYLIFLNAAGWLRCAASVLFFKALSVKHLKNIAK